MHGRLCVNPRSGPVCWNQGATGAKRVWDMIERDANRFRRFAVASPLAISADLADRITAHPAGKHPPPNSIISENRCYYFLLPDHKSRCRLGTEGLRVVRYFAPKANVQDGCIGRRIRNSPIVISVQIAGECNPCCERPTAI